MLKTLAYMVVFLVTSSDAQNKSFVLTPKMAQACKEHICYDGYSYKKFYKVDSSDLKQIRKDSDIAFEMHLGIQATSNGHILLSPVPRPAFSDPVYEFVVGGGGNKFTELRRNLKRNARSSVNTPRILSSFELRGFYIKISQDGIIEFGREGEVLPLLTYIDVSPLEIKYFSFAAWTGVEAKFLYDCPIPVGNGTESPNSEEVQPPLSIPDQLKMSRLLYRSPSIPPKPIMDVRLGIKVTSIKYDAFEAMLTTYMSVVMSWTDESLAWYPDKYNGTTSLKFRQGQIWRPMFYVFNSDNEDIFDARSSDLITIVNSGEATFHFQTKVNTYCRSISPDSGKYSKWPHDTYLCSIVIQPQEAHESIALELMKTNDNKMHIFSDVDEVIQNEWEYVINQLIVKAEYWNSFYHNTDNQTHQSDRLLISVDLQRKATAYNIVFYTPLIVMLIFFFISFLTEPLTMERIWFFTGYTIIITMGLCYVDFLIPTHTLPTILILYTTVLAGVLIALLIQVILMTDLVDKIRKTERMQKVMALRVFRIIFCLPSYNMTSSATNGGYSLQEDDEQPSTPMNRNIEEMESETPRSFGDKKELAEVVDKFLFVIYFLTFAVMILAHY